MHTFSRHFCLGKSSISYGIKIAPFPSLLVIGQVKQSAPLLGITSWASILKLRHLFTVMTLGCYLLNFIFQSFEACKRMIKRLKAHMAPIFLAALPNLLMQSYR